MNGRGFVNFLIGIVVLVLLIGVGVGIYDAGIQQGIAQTANVPVGAVAPYAYGYGWGFHGGFGIFGFLFPLLFIFLIFGLVRAAFRGGRGGWGGHGWGGYGWGPNGPDRSAWQAERERQLAEMHNRFHEGGGQDPASPGPDRPAGNS